MSAFTETIKGLKSLRVWMFEEFIQLSPGGKDVETYPTYLRIVCEFFIRFHFEIRSLESSVFLFYIYSIVFASCISTIKTSVQRPFFISIWLYFRGGSEGVQWGFSEGSVRVQWGFNEVQPSEPPRKALGTPSEGWMDVEEELVNL
jgi:hypothetical protein